MEFREAVRKRPGMYLGDPRNGQAAQNAILELVGNAIDQFLAGRASKIEVVIDGANIEVTDDGPGLPFGQASRHDVNKSQAEADLEFFHSTATSTGHAPHIHVASSGVGLAVVNALCDQFTIISDDGKYRWEKSYRQGIGVGALSKHMSSGPLGTSFKLRLSSDLVGTPDLAALSEKLETQTYLYPNLQVTLNDKAFVAPEGLLDLARQISKGEADGSLCFYCHETFGDIHIQAALIGRTVESRIQRSWVNGQESHYDGSHIRGLKRALDSFGWQPEVSLLHIIMHDPKFAGPTKDILLSRVVCDKVEIAMREAIAAANLTLR